MTKRLFFLFLVFYGTTLLGQTKYKDGEHVFKSNCSICHSFDKKLIASPLNNILSRRKKEWVVNYILDDAEFMKTDTIAKRLNTTGNMTTNSHNFKNNLSKKDMKKLIAFLEAK